MNLPRQIKIIPYFEVQNFYKVFSTLNSFMTGRNELWLVRVGSVAPLLPPSGFVVQLTGGMKVSSFLFPVPEIVVTGQTGFLRDRG